MRRGLTLALTLALPPVGGCGSAYRRSEARPPVEVLAAGEPTDELPARGLDVLVWNIAKARQEGWAEQFSTLAEGTQLVLLQEAYLAPRMTEALGDRPARQWLMAPSFVFARRNGTPATGVAIGSTARAADARALVTLATEPITGTPKASLVATYELEGTEARLLVVCIHAINFRRAPRLRAQLRALEPAIAGHAGPVLLAGDLNTHHRPRLRVLEDFTAALGLRPVFDNWQPPPRQHRPAEDGRSRHGRWPLDHVYVRGLTVQDARIGREHGSDHAPLLVRLALTP